jgi:hypothetical protein
MVGSHGDCHPVISVHRESLANINYEVVDAIITIRSLFRRLLRELVEIGKQKKLGGQAVRAK